MEKFPHRLEFLLGDGLQGRRAGIRVSCVLPGSVNTEFGGDQSSAHADWKLDASDIARAVIDLLRHPARSLPSRVELRPSVPRE